MAKKEKYFIGFNLLYEDLNNHMQKQLKKLHVDKSEYLRQLIIKDMENEAKKTTKDQ